MIDRTAARSPAGFERLVRAVVRPALLAVVVAAVFMTEPLLSTYMRALFIQAFLFAILAISVDLLWGYTGILSLGQSAFFGVGGYAIGIVFVHITTGAGAWPLALVAGPVAAALFAAAVAWFAFYTRIDVPALYIAVVTLAVAVIFNQLVLSGGEFTGASTGLTGFTSNALSDRAWYLLAAAVLVGVTAVSLIVVRSDAGLVLAAIRDNEERCRYLGVNVPLVKSLLFAACGAVAGLSGLLYVAYTNNVAPSLVGFALATDAVIWTAVGGRGTLFGPIIGAVLINVGGPPLNARYPLWWQLFLGALFVFVVIFLPRGIFPTLGAWAERGLLFAARATLGMRRMRHAAAARPAARPRRSHLEVGSQHIAPTGSDGAAADGVVLQVEDVRKHFGSFEAVAGVSFEARRGELVSIVGPNGAGKTTLVRCIANGRERTSGHVTITGHSVDRQAPHRLVAFGVGRKFQAANVFESLTVAESLQLATWRGRFPSLWRKMRMVSLPGPALRVLETTGLDGLLDAEVRSLGHGRKQALELAMVLALEPTVLLLDEPTAGLTHDERSAIAGLLADLVHVERLCVLLIEHDFAFVKQISTRMIVLHEGELLLDGTVAEVAQSDVVRAVYLGQRAH